MQLKNAWRNVTRHHRRSIIAGSALASACFGLIFLQSFFAGLFDVHAQNTIHSRFGHGQIMTKGYWDKAFEKASDHWIDNPDQILSELSKIPQVAEVFPRTQFFALLSNGTTSIAARGQGIVGKKESSFFNKMNFVEGGPLADKTDGIVIGIGIAKALGLKLGDRVTVLAQTEQGTLNAVDTILSGVFHVGMKEADDMLFQIQLDQAQVLLQSNKIESIAIGLKVDHDWPAFAAIISDKYPKLEALSVFVLDQAWADNGRKFLGALMRVFQLIITGMVVMAVYGTSSQLVLERRREIGVLRANGESRKDVIQLFVSENLIIGIISAAIGLGLILFTQLIARDGFVLPPTPGTNRELPVPLLIRYGDIAVSLGFAIGASLIACFIASWRGISSRITDSLRIST